ncbi:DUF6099 family protein [Streptomyces sp. N2-109]|uniref:DUF6099 family protein n=1 Tax=Streptomyces gossypii TaxID=2883101 RepID=A0ABT2JSG9_9ACTN|nr:DUF6099 family protein [Streptomyces gossypii]MCT2590776.1 DUF6099 family protein [Streptomyces gossypii]
MEAVRLIEVSRQALAQSKALTDVVAEAWQTQALVAEVGSRLAACGPPVVRAEAIGLSEAGKRGCGSLRHPARSEEDIRARRLSGVSDPRQVLVDLAGLLGESGVALVGVAVAADEGLYWQCLDAIDAADESGDRVAGILRSLALPERGGARVVT